MLADLTLVNCYDRSSMSPKTREKVMLESAKANLKNLAFFGVKERMADSQFLFEHLFDMRWVLTRRIRLQAALKVYGGHVPLEQEQVPEYDRDAGADGPHQRTQSSGYRTLRLCDETLQPASLGYSQ